MLAADRRLRRTSRRRTAAVRTVRVFLFAVCLHVALASATPDAADRTQVRVVTIHRHNTSSFTEGLLIDGDSVLESTGLRHQSFIREYPLPQASSTGTVSLPTPVQEVQLDAAIFGEGIAVFDDKLYSLTYKHQKLLSFSRDGLEPLDEFPIVTSTGEGWGMTTDGKFLIVSDGSAQLAFLDPTNDFQVDHVVNVAMSDGSLVTQVNELEWVEGEILANVWFQNCVLRIDPVTGEVIERIDLDWLPSLVSNLHSDAMLNDERWRHEAVMNGIAYSRKRGHVFLTGKLWDSLFELEFSYLDSHRLPIRDDR